MKNISILKKIKRCLRKTNHDKKFNFKKIKFTTDLNCLYIDQLRYEHQYYKKASVFFLLKELEQNLYVVFTKRSKNLSSYPGQISFPGGRVDKKDNSLLHAAFREVEEEIGVKKDSIKTLGLLPPHETISQFIIYPFVGFIKKPIKFFINKNEVEELFLVPFDFFLDTKSMQYHKFISSYEDRGYFAVPYGPYYIWGATARIIKSFVENYQN